RLYEALPPHAIEAEMALLGSMILDWQVVGDVIQLIQSPDDFFKPAHGAIYHVLVELYDQQQSIDMVQLNQKLVDKSLLDQVGGLEYLVELAESVPSASSATHYASIVHDKALLRRLIDEAGQILEDCYTTDEKVVDLLDRVETRIFEIAENKSDDGAADIATGIPDSANGRFEVTGLGNEYLNTASTSRSFSFETDMSPADPSNPDSGGPSDVDRTPRSGRAEGRRPYPHTR
ncbi:MAG: DnaB-like helicase N-terminal domain-containing protein, partial [Myxococcota bacterium]